MSGGEAERGDSALDLIERLDPLKAERERLRDDLGAFVSGLERSGMSFGECMDPDCGRPYGSREGSGLCPICRGVVPDDGWRARNRARKRLVDLLEWRIARVAAASYLENAVLRAGVAGRMLDLDPEPSLTRGIYFERLAAFIAMGLDRHEATLCATLRLRPCDLERRLGNPAP